MEKNKEYRIKGKHPYFKDKYGTDNPVFRVEDTDKEIFGKSCLNNFISLWEEYYERMKEEDKQLLPLRKVSYLAPND